jgi:uncharacterized protein (TIGR03437 family)
MIVKTTRRLSITLLLSAAGLFATTPAPAPNSVQNPGSNFLPGLPSYGAAQGSIIVVYGSNLSGTTLVQQMTLPLQTTLNNTTIKVVVGATTVNLFMVYTFNSQLAAVLPSNTPVGNGTLTVTYNGQSGSTPIVVVASAPGIFTVNETGTGPASATHADNKLITATDAANSNEEIQIYATGLSGLPAGSDATSPGAIQFPTTNLAIYVGGTKLDPSAIKYYGRNPADPGLDQINIVIPPNVTGCTVSLVMQSGTGASAIISNTVTLAVAASGSTCSDQNGISTSNLTGKTTISQGVMSLSQSSISFTLPNTAAIPRIVGTQVNAGGSATFQKYTSDQFAASGSAYGISIGSCVMTITNTNNNPPSNITGTGLDAGPQIAVLTPSNSTVNLSTSSIIGKGSYSSPTGGFSSIAPGVYHFTGPGGADVGAFTASLTVPTALTWTNQTAILGSPIVRTSPLTLTWTGGDPGSYVYITGSSVNTVNNASLGAGFFCIAPLAPGSFTIPPPVLLSVPATTSNGQGFLLMGSQSAPVSFTAQGLDLGMINSSSTSGGLATFQ